MLLLPVSHGDGLVRRLPMVSLGLIATCFALQVHSCAVTPALEARLEALQRDIAQVEVDAVQAHLAALDAGTQPDDDDAVQDEGAAEIEHPLRAEFAAFDHESLTKFRAGTLTAPDDAHYRRYLELRDAYAAVELELPVIRFGYRPALDGFGSLVSSMFAHGGWLHLLGNMWFLYLVGCNLEDRWGRAQFALFYLVAGLISALGFGALHPDMKAPLVGASGAIAGAMGAFMICYARTRVKMFYLYFLMMTPRWGTFQASAWIVLALWVAEQLLMTFVEVSSSGTEVAHSAHAGGFVFGALVAFALRKTGIDARLDAASEQAADAGTEVWTEHPLYLSAMELRDAADDAGATAQLMDLVADAPQHQGAHEALFALGTARRDLDALDVSVPYLIDSYAQKQDFASLGRLFQELRRALPDYGLTDQELLRIATAAQRAQDGALAIRVVTELLQRWPTSTLKPRALWVAAEVQGRLGAVELQRDTLLRIVRGHPEHACARLANEQLARDEAPA